MEMFGLTKHQFLKRSKEALKETGVQTLSFRRLMNQKAKGEISLLEVQRSLDRLRNDAEDTFSQYEKLNPPSKCLGLKQRAIKALIMFHESLVTYSESLPAREPALQEKLLKRSSEELDEYKELSFHLSREVDSNLQKK